MEVGTQVFCTSKKLGLLSEPGVVTKLQVLGCKESIIVALNTGKQVAFFGPKTACVSTEPLAKDPTETSTSETSTSEQAPKALTRKRSTRSKKTTE